MPRWAKLILKTFAWILGSAVSLVFLVVLAVLGLAIYGFMKPEWSLTERNVRPVQKFVAKYDVGLNWEHFGLKVWKKDRWSHDFVITLDNFAFSVPMVPLRVQGQHFVTGGQIQWDFKAWRTPMKIVHLATVKETTLAQGYVWLGEASHIARTPSTFDSNRIALPEFLTHTVMAPVHLQANRLQVDTEAGRLMMSADVAATQESGVLHLHAQPLAFSPGVCWQNTVSATDWQERGNGDAAGADTCLKDVEAHVALAVPERFLRVKEVGPLRAVADVLSLNFMPHASSVVAEGTDWTAPERPVGFSLSQLPPLLADASWQRVSAGIGKGTVKMAVSGKPATVTFGASAQLQSHDDTMDSLWNGALNAKAICLESEIAKGCVDRLAVEADWDQRRVRPRGPRIVIREAAAEAKAFLVQLPEAQPKSGADAKSAADAVTKTDVAADPDSVPWSRNFRLVPKATKAIGVKLGTLTLKQKVGALWQQMATAKASLSLVKQKGDQLNWEAAVDVKPQAATAQQIKDKTAAGWQSVRRATVNGLAETASDFTQWRTTLYAKAEMDGARTVNGKFTGGTEAKSDHIQLDLRAVGLGFKPMERIAASAKGYVGPKGLDLQIGGDVRLKADAMGYVLTMPGDAQPGQCPPVKAGPGVHVQTLKWDKCEVAGNYPKGVSKGAFTLDCQLKLGADWKPGDFPDLGKARDLALGVDIGAHVNGTEEAIPKWAGQVKVGMRDWDLGEFSKILDLKSSANLVFAVPQSDESQPATWSTEGDLALRVQSFAKIVDILHTTAIAIPAPLNDLEGQTTVTAHLSGSSLQDAISIPLSVATDLNSKEQALKVAGAGRFDWKKLKTGPTESSFQFAVTPEKVDMTMPRITLRSKLPLFFPDPRIQVSNCPKPEASPSTFAYHIEFPPEAKTPVLIRTNLANDPVPITLAGLTISNDGISGPLDVGTFGFELFRRKAKVNHFDVTLQPDVDTKVIDGDIQFDYPEYTINILFTGTAEEPIIHFESIPVRTEREIISILLYGQDMASVDDEQLQTADDMRAAMADRIIGLASLYLLASSPIESVRYNPASKVFQARVRLDSKTSLNLGGAAQENSSVGVRRRLTQSWSVQTSLEKDTESGVASGSATLEWSKRF